MSAPRPSAATRSPSAAGPIRSTSRAKTGSICWYGKTRRVHQDRDREHAQDRRVRADLAEPGGHAGQDGLAAGRAGQGDVPLEAVRAGQGAERESGEDGVAGARAQAGEEDPAEERPDHLRALHGHALQRDDGRQTLPTRDGEEDGPARREVEDPGDAEDHLDRDQGAESAQAGGEEKGERRRGRHVQDLHRDHHADPGQAVGEHAGEGTEQHHGGGPEEGRHAHHQWRVGQGEGDPAEDQEIHPARGAGAEADQPEDPVTDVAERLEHGGRQTGRRSPCGRRVFQ